MKGGLQTKAWLLVISDITQMVFLCCHCLGSNIGITDSGNGGATLMLW